MRYIKFNKNIIILINKISKKLKKFLKIKKPLFIIKFKVKKLNNILKKVINIKVYIIK